MELELHRVDLLQTGAAAPGCLRVLPPGEKKTQKVAVADAAGVVQCFSVKKGEVALAFKTMPGTHKITSLTLGRHPRQRDKIFIAGGGVIRGMTKKGKEFFRFTSALTEPIAHLAVADRDIWASCEYVHNHFLESADKGLYLAPDRILTAEVIPLHGPTGFVPALGCRDRVLRVLSPSSGSAGGREGAPPLFEVPLQSAPTALLHVANSHDTRGRFPAGSQELLVGCDDGSVVQLMVEPAAVRQGFVIPAQQGRGAVCALYCGADFSKSGCADIVLGREDGWLEVWDVDDAGTPLKVYAAQLPESICSVDGGYVTSAAAPEIIVHTFTGKVIAFSPDPAALALGVTVQQQPGPSGALAASLATIGLGGSGGDSAAGPAAGAAAALALSPAQQQHQLVAALHARVAKATAEVEELRRAVDLHRSRAAACPAAAAAVPAGGAGVVDVSHSLKLVTPGAGAGANPAAAPGASPGGGGSWAAVGGGRPYYALTLESAAPLFAVGLAVSREVALMDVPGNVAIVSRTEPGEGGAPPWGMLATYRCQDATNRLTVGFRLAEGAPAALQAYVVPAISPKACSIVYYRLPPLCLHQRIALDVVGLAGEQRGGPGPGGGAGGAPFSELSLSGSFSLQEVHAWAAACLPDLPPHPPTGAAGGGGARYSFRSAPAGSLLGCSLGVGAAQFVSDNISTLSLLHDGLMRGAAADKVRASSAFAVHPEALDRGAALLWPELELQRARQRRLALLHALQELRLQDGDVSYLAPEYRTMLDDSTSDDTARRDTGAGRGAGGAGGGGDVAANGCGGGAGSADPAQHTAELAAAEEAVRQLFKDWCRLGGGGGGGGAAKGRMAGLDALLTRAGEPGAQAADALAYMRGGSGR